MNKISGEKEEKLQALFVAGFTIRQAAKRAGVAKHTAARYLHALPPLLCPCGQPALHRGWCTVRVARSPSRQQFLDNFASGGIKPATKRRWQRECVDEERAIDLLLSIRVDRAARLTALRISRVQKISAAQLIDSVLASLPPLPAEIKEEVRQDLFVAVLEGAIDFKKIKEAVPEYVKGAFVALSDSISLDAPDRTGRTFLERL
jgi:hypothetical protein